MMLTANRLVNNAKSQLLAMRSEYNSDANCFDNGAPDQLTADFVFAERYGTLAEYQRSKGEDLGSREGGCGPLPEKVDVQTLHAETMAYAERARKLLSEAVTKNGAGKTP
jgi:hypothetical protein